MVMREEEHKKRHKRRLRQRVEELKQEEKELENKVRIIKYHIQLKNNELKELDNPKGTEQSKEQRDSAGFALSIKKEEMEKELKVAEDAWQRTKNNRQELEERLELL